jgi:hypothetical protein
MEQTTQANFNKFAIPMRMGFMIALFKIILTTVGYKFFAGSWGMSMLFMVIGLIVGIILFVQTGKMQRKEMGGYIDIKQAFQAIFVAALITAVLSTIYDYIYIKFLDPGMTERIREATMATMEKWGAPQEKIDEVEKTMDSGESLKLSKQLQGLLTSIIFYGILSLICAAIVKKNKPEHIATQQ